MKVRCALDLQIRSVAGDVYLRSPREARSFGGGTLSDTHLMVFLSELQEWTSIDAAAERIAALTGVTAAVARPEVDRLLAAAILVSDDESGEQRQLFSGKALWDEYGWGDAFAYHASTDAIPRIDYRHQDGQRQDVALMREYSSAEAPPPVYMPAVSSRITPLPEPGRTLGVSVTAALDELALETAEAAPALDALTLSRILWFGFGQTGTKKLPVTGEHITKTSPSGGSRHPTEAYVFALNVAGLARGVYHYGVKNHELEQLQDGLDEDWVAANIIGVPRWRIASPAALILLTTRVQVSMYRYRESNSYRVLHYDTGHVLETASLVSRMLGQTAFRAFSMNEQAVAGLLGNDRLMNPAMSFMAIGWEA
ncbi:SagB-type dehydrogenase family enzyme [Streptomyces sp. 3330]|uniref:SagB family peptide dehydrogenase n=1 Tax=Streptomyces sp. 3330 TaxID=2817755 RepID=UPI0028633D9E|nr:SagB family peptide dehydrogenase [Streptomyces sp. 3330]MDR6981003.1 SagB-type dehydrogenase family enzyme [Streptomyces sp. 3330]